MKRSWGVETLSLRHPISVSFQFPPVARRPSPLADPQDPKFGFAPVSCGGIGAQNELPNVAVLLGT